VTVADALPSGPGVDWTIDSTTLDGVAAPGLCAITGAPGSQQLACGGAVLTLASGDVLAVHVTSPTTWTAGGAAAAGVNSCAGGAKKDGVYDNTATVTASNVKSTARMTDTASTAVLCPQLGLTKTAAAASVDAGSDISFQVTASNTGAGRAGGVTVVDVLPGGAGVDWALGAVTVNGTAPAANPCAISGAAPSQTLTCGGPAFSLGAADVLAATLTSHTSGANCPAAGGTSVTYSNTAGVSAGNDPNVPTASADVTVHCPDVTLAKTADAASVAAGGAIGYTLTATNTGSGTAKAVSLTDPLPSGPGLSWTITSADPALTCTIVAGTLGCTGDLAPGAHDSVHISSPTTGLSCGSYANTASLTWSTAVAALTATATERVNCPVPPSAPELRFTKTADGAAVTAGSSIGFVLRVSNTGSGTASGVTISDPLPAGRDVAWTLGALTGPPAGACSIAGAAGSQALTCALGDLPAGAAVSVHVTSGTDTLSCGAYANSATVTAANAATQTATANTTVTCAVQTVQVTADDPQVSSGQPIGFTFVGGAVTDTVLDAVLVSNLPPGGGVLWSLDGPVTMTGPGSGTGAAGASCAITGAAGAQVLRCTFASMGAGERFQVHVTSATTAQSCQSYAAVGDLSASNAAAVSDRATTAVLCVLPVQTQRPHPGSGAPGPATHSVSPLATTGAGPVRSQLGWALALLVAGGLTLLLAQRRRPRREH
jgi:uncharacterized repeat protein (TIGR01451 family)